MRIVEHRKGRISYELGDKREPHEFRTAEFFAEQGKSVEFIKPVRKPGVRTPDAMIDGVEWEFKFTRIHQHKAIQQCAKEFELNDALKRMIIITKDRKSIELY